MSLETEIPELLLIEMNDFIESSSELDKQSFINSPLTDFLLQNGCQINQLKESYSKYLLNNTSTN